MTEGQPHPLARSIESSGAQLRAWTTHNERSILWWAVALFMAFILTIGIWKIWSYAYNGLDLAIYRQVAANSIRGDLFQMTIHPHSYLGDHFEILFALILPLYAAFQHPMTLVAVQAAAIALAVFPLASIAKRFVGTPWHLLFAVGFLANPAVQNMALYEFHMLPFAMPILSFAILAYLEKRYVRFMLLLLLALTVREDVSFVIVGFGLLALIQRRPIQWSIVPIMLGGAWFFGALKIVSLLNGYGHYKFLAYYGWLGGSVSEIAKNALLHIDKVILHALTFPSIAFLATLLLPFAFLPLFRPIWLVPVIPTILQLMMMQTPSELSAQMHYPSVIIPFLVLATAVAFRDILHPPDRGVFAKIGRERGMAVIVYSIVVLYSMVVIGSFPRALIALTKTGVIADRVKIERALIDGTAAQPTIAGYETILGYSERPRLYSLHYEFLGKRQYSDIAYTIPDDARIVLYDLRDALMFQLLYKIEDADNRNGYARVRDLLASRNFIPTRYIDRFVLFEKEKGAGSSPLYYDGLPQHDRVDSFSRHETLTFLGWSSPGRTLTTVQETAGHATVSVLPLELSFRKETNSMDIDILEFRFVEGDQVRYRTFMPLGAGLYPTSDWDAGETVTSAYRLIVPHTVPRRNLHLEVRVVHTKGEVALNEVRGLSLNYTAPEVLGDAIALGPVN